ncbi:glycosyl transferase [Frankia sp. ACN1ag]|uniref:glycosyl transferase n=1 Tax=Frankia sp. ACN1ag TaxID=102891 RepID=UPI0006DC9528|nr:glycosyl transferase [Frankia sp. ACN1ag]KQC36351.1 glycosyl transferase [Frankia sp. ACN1ag]
MKTVAVIVHWGPHQPTVELAERLDASPSIAQVTIVANDGSTRPAELATSVAWILPPRNLGFGGGFQLAVRDYPAAGAYLLVNNDIRIDEATIRACLDLLTGTNIGVVAPTLINGDGLQSGSARLSPVLVAPRARRPPDDRPCEADWVTGAVMFIKAECLRRVPFDGRYFLGFEDVDFCYRVREAGWSVVLSPHRAWHTGSTMIPHRGNAYYIVRNRLWFTRIRGWRLRTTLVAAVTAAVVLPRSVVLDVARGRGLETTALVRHGLIDGLGPLPPPGDPRADEPRVAHWTARR